MSVNGFHYMLAQNQDPALVKAEIAAAARDGVKFVTVSVFGRKSVDVLVTPSVTITFETETTHFDSEEDEDRSTLSASPDFDHYHPEY